ncbi:MAG TPA: DUF308 domain-containing protein [Bryobacteraceae bacterium]|jgi:uncharacterized membrane protein HdeD (DUF308 family)|nr:DUF308 domain-containing protein [Bryobacteraceae bacterium]
MFVKPWSLVIRGLMALVLALITGKWPAMSLRSLLLVFGGYALVDGLVAMAGAMRSAESGKRWTPLIVEGVTGILTAFAAFSWPSPFDLSVTYLIAAWALVTGVLEVMTGLRLRKSLAGEWLLTLSGFSSITLGILMLTIRVAADVARLVGIYAFIFGIMLLALGFRLRPWLKRPAIGAPL